MPDPADSRFASAWKWTLCAALLFLAVGAAERLHTIRSLEEMRISEHALPAMDDDSLSGLVHGQRTLPLAYPDSYHWIRQTQEMLASGEWRVRHTMADNAPAGREVHWSGALRWWLAALAWFDHQVNGVPIGRAVERVAPFALPLSLALFLLLATPLTVRWLGGVPAAVFPPLLVTSAPLFEQFGVEAPDHHGWVIACGMVCVAALVAGGAGWVRREGAGDISRGFAPPSRSCARRRFVLSGIAGGAGLWISAATQVPVLLAVGIGVLLGAWTAGTRRDDVMPDPALWRLWGAVGAATSFAFYLLEYFPGHVGMRLEVNHPLYALAWLGAGDVLCRLVRWRVATPREAPGAWLPRLLPGLLALVALPLVIAVAPERTFWVADRFLWALHVDYIKEFKGLGFIAAQVPWSRLPVVVSLLPLGLLLVVPLLRRRDIVAPARAALWLALLPALATLALAFSQSRWYGPACGFALVAWLAGLFVEMRAADAGLLGHGRRLGWWLMGALVVIPNAGSSLKTAWTTWRSEPSYGLHQLQELVVRDVAHWLRARTGVEPAVVLSDPTTTTALLYFGGHRGIGTLYWENLPGLRTLVRFQGAGSAEAAHAVARESGVTHLVIFPWLPFAEESARLARGQRAADAAPGYAFLRSLRSPEDVPAWLEPLAYPMPGHPQLQALGAVRVFAVVPPMSPAEQGVRHAQYFRATGDSSAALQQLRKAFQNDANSLPAFVFLARLAQERGAEREWRQALEMIRRLLPTQDAGLRLDDRLDLLQVLIGAGEEDGTVRQLEVCLAQADEAALRRLRPEALFEFGEVLREAAAEHPATPGVLANIDALVPSPVQERLLFEHAVQSQRAGQEREAAVLYRRHLALNPAAAASLGNLAWILATSGDDGLHAPPEALALARRAVAAAPTGDAFSRHALAAAAAATGDFPAAVQEGRLALRLAESARQTELAASLRACLAYYESGRAYRSAEQARR